MSKEALLEVTNSWTVTVFCESSIPAPYTGGKYKTSYQKVSTTFVEGKNHSNKNWKWADSIILQMT